MRIGLIARADNSGLGIQCLEFARHLRPVKTLVIDVGHLHNNTTDCNKATHLNRYSAATISKGWEPSEQLLARWLEGLDVVYSAETFYSNEFPELAQLMGVRTVLHYNHEFLAHLDNPHLPEPDVFAAPSMWRYEEVPFTNKEFLPVPIALDRFGDRTLVGYPRQGDAARCPNKGPRNFLHIVGRPAIFDRNGTPDVLAALPHVKSQIRLTLKCQDRDYLHTLMRAHGIPSNVELVCDSSDTENYWDNYRTGDVMVLPRRYGGLCLPANEALGSGMPVVMTDIDPNNTWLPAEWLVPASKTAEFHAANRVEVFRADPIALAQKIDQFATDDDFYLAAQKRASELATEYSWDTLLPRYEKVLSGDLASL